MPPKEAGNFIDAIFDWCVDLLLWLASVLGVSYNEINVWIFCVLWPLITVGLVTLVLLQRKTVNRLKRQADRISEAVNEGRKPIS